MLGGLVSFFFVLFAGMGLWQAIQQVLSVLLTVVAALVTGYITGIVLLRNPAEYSDLPDYEDAVWWIDVDDA